MRRSSCRSRRWWRPSRCSSGELSVRRRWRRRSERRGWRLAAAAAALMASIERWAEDHESQKRDNPRPSISLAQGPIEVARGEEHGGGRRNWRWGEENTSAAEETAAKRRGCKMWQNWFRPSIPPIYRTQSYIFALPPLFYARGTAIGTYLVPRGTKHYHPLDRTRSNDQDLVP